MNRKEIDKDIRIRGRKIVNFIVQGDRIAIASVPLKTDVQWEFVFCEDIKPKGEQVCEQPPNKSGPVRVDNGFTGW